jgi:hypothetical protein
MPINSQHTKGGGGGGGDEGEGGGGARGGGGGRKGKKEGEGAKGTRKPKVDKPTENRNEDPGRPEGIVITTFRWVYTNSTYSIYKYLKMKKQCTATRLICSSLVTRWQTWTLYVLVKRKCAYCPGK